MPYATQQDLIDRFGEEELLELADRDGDQVLDAALVDGALADADELINSYLGKRYQLPLSAVPAVLTRTAADMARFFLYKDDPTEAVQGAYNAALKWLKDVSDGRAVLDAAGSEPAPAEGGVSVESSERQFSRDSLKGY